MKTPSKKTAWAVLGLVVLGCQTPGATGSGRALSASENSGAFATEGNSSDSGNSSEGSSNGSGDSSNGSGESSRGSGESSGDSSRSSEDSGNSSNDSNSEESSEESSNESSNESTDNSSDSSKSEGGNPVVSATVVGLTAAGVGAVLWQSIERASRPASPPAPAPQEVARAAQTYLRSRAYQLREDLALGAGPMVEDLASLAQIRRENLGRFGRLLRAHRAELLALADARTLTPDRALAWLQRVGEIARMDPRLEQDGRSFMARHGRTGTGALEAEGVLGSEE